MVKKSIFLSTILLLAIYVYPQESPIHGDLPINSIRFQNIFFSRRDINPSLTDDSIKFEANLLANYTVIGYENSPRKYFYSIASKLFKTKSLLGLQLGFEEGSSFKAQSLKINYRYNLKINEKSNFKMGINLGLLRTSFFSTNLYFVDYIQIVSRYSDWGYQPTMDIGLTYSRLNQNIGVSYCGMNESYIESPLSRYYIIDKIFVGNYYSNYKITNRLKLTPELLIYRSSHETNIVLKSVLSYRDKISIGGLVDQSAYFGVMLSGILFKKFEIGYLYESITEHSLYEEGTHSFKFGLLLK